MKEFLLQHYIQVNENLRESHRKRDILLGSYFTLSVTGISLSISPVCDECKYIIFIPLIVLGIIVAVIVAKYRGWHGEYLNVAMAIHKCFLDEDYDLSKAARALKAARDLKHEKRGAYFYIGVEFWMMVLTLFFPSLEAVLLIWFSDLKVNWLKYLLCIGIFLVIMIIGLLLYWVHLKNREKNFPGNSCYILDNETEKRE